MKYIRVITVLLSMTLAISPALAANCAASYASKTVMSAINPDDMSTMANCHEHANDKDATSSHHDKSGTHQSCPMNAGCHFSPALSTDTSFQHVLVAATTLLFPSFDSTEKSVDLSPPLKPPA